MTSPPKPIRLGVLAASRIATKALIQPAALVDGVEVVAVGARDLGRAEAAAAQWAIPRAYGSYEELLADDGVDAVYVATPASLHRAWVNAAVGAGRHVLVEKPLAANADDARAIQTAAQQRPELVCMEAFHWRYHPYSQRWIDIINSGRLGTVVRAAARFNLPATAIPRSDIRWDVALGGGATMDLGCYSIQWVRAVADAAGFDSMPTVTTAVAETPEHEIDGRLTAALRWDAGSRSIEASIDAMIESSMIESAEEATIDLRVVGTAGEMLVGNPLSPHNGATIAVTGDHPETIDVDEIPGGRETTYYYQLVAFRDAIRSGASFPTDIADGVANMAVIDDAYRCAGLLPRPTMTD